MMFMKGGGLFSILMVLFVGWVFIASSDEERLVRACKPTQWIGGFATSIVDLTAPKYSSTVDGWIDSLEYSCQYMLWRLFYESAWLEQQDDMEKNLYRAIDDDKKASRNGKKMHD